MARIDLNADLGEADEPTTSDLAVLDSVTSVSIACGFHAGNRAVMRVTAEAAVARGVVVGAHVSYRDREGFGRRDLDVPASTLLADLEEQYTTLAEDVARAGGSVAYVKPHGALYNRMAWDLEVAGVVVEAVRRCGARMLLAQSGTPVVDLAHGTGIVLVAEAFADRAYLPDGRLVPRSEPGAVVTDPIAVGERALALARDRGVHAIDGSWLSMVAHSLCVHGDSPGAAANSRSARERLLEAGITLRSFTETDPSP